MKATITAPMGAHTAHHAASTASHARSIQPIIRAIRALASQRAALWLMAVAAAAIYVALLLDDSRLLAWATIGGTAAMLRYITPMTKGGQA